MTLTLEFPEISLQKCLTKTFADNCRTTGVLLLLSVLSYVGWCTSEKPPCCSYITRIGVIKMRYCWVMSDGLHLAASSNTKCCSILTFQTTCFVIFSEREHRVFLELSQILFPCFLLACPVAPKLDTDHNWSTKREVCHRSKTSLTRKEHAGCLSF